MVYNKIYLLFMATTCQQRKQKKYNRSEEKLHFRMVLVALAWMEGSPAHSNAGKVMSEPPPAMEFMIPPTVPAVNKMRVFHSAGIS